MSHRAKEALAIFAFFAVIGGVVYGLLWWHYDVAAEDCHARGGRYLENQALCISPDGRILP